MATTTGLLLNDPLILGGGFISHHLNGKRITRKMGDLRDPLFIQSIAKQTAASTSSKSTPWVLCAAIGRRRRDDHKAYQDNLSIAHAVAEAVTIHKPAHLTFLSSCDLYGNPQQIINESTPPEPTTPYGLAKLESEFILSDACQTTGTPLTILRLPGVYGLGDQGISFLSEMVDSARHQGVITLHGDGSQKRDIVAVQDLVRIIHNPVPGTTNIATGTSLSLLEIAHEISSHFAARIVFVPDPAPGTRPHHLQFNNSLCLKTYGPLTPIAKGIAAYAHQT